MSGGTVGTYGTSDISSVGVSESVGARGGVTRTFQLVLGLDSDRLAVDAPAHAMLGALDPDALGVTGLVPTVVEGP